MFDVQGKKFLITGASGGIGNDLVHFLHKQGAILTISGTNKEKLELLVDSLGERIHYIQFDLSNYTNAESLVTDASNLMGGFDGLICNAGLTNDMLSMRMGVEAWDKVINVNLSSVFFLNKAASKLLLRNRYGKIVNISSVVAFTGNPGQANYCAAKSGVIAMSKSIALEYASKNIAINCIAPGFITTPMTDKLSQEQKDLILTKIPMARFGKGADICGAVLFLLSSASDYVTGQVIHINGGMYM